MPQRYLKVMTLAALALGALAACAEESPHTAGDTLAPAAVPADSAAGADRTPPDSGAAPDTARSSGDTGRAPRAPRASGGGAPTRADVDRLYARARALAKPDGCQEDADCRTAPAGARGCGGPSEFLVYCPRSTNVAQLQAVLAERERAEREYNRINQIASTCEMRMAPPVEAIGGRCRAVQSQP